MKPAARATRFTARDIKRWNNDRNRINFGTQALPPQLPDSATKTLFQMAVTKVRGGK